MSGETGPPDHPPRRNRTPRPACRDAPGRLDTGMGQSSADTADSRAATDWLLGQLRAGRWRPRAWIQIVARASRRSAAQARKRPRALLELSLLHAALLEVAPPRRRRWILISWALAGIHLGLLDQRRSLGAANTISLLRANLPAVAERIGPRLGFLAIGSDLLDGRLARHRGTVTAFGANADALADAVFWTWYARHHERHPLLRAAALAAWTAPVAAVGVASLRAGRMIDPPRPAMIRPAAAMQAVLAVRALRTEYPGPSSPASPPCCSQLPSPAPTGGPRPPDRLGVWPRSRTRNCPRASRREALRCVRGA